MVCQPSTSACAPNARCVPWSSPPRLAVIIARLAPPHGRNSSSGLRLFTPCVRARGGQGPGARLRGGPALRELLPADASGTLHAFPRAGPPPLRHQDARASISLAVSIMSRPHRRQAILGYRPRQRSPGICDVAARSGAAYVQAAPVPGFSRDSAVFAETHQGLRWACRLKTSVHLSAFPRCPAWKVIWAPCYLVLVRADSENACELR
ncbi:hypothetical protein OBBRIDRAFT_34597 [Obba rivulosa]|uniref:Uncharacterized protein n=1 Tax=Obba rivulosa TaxID=1052685 RepID=A0A8E2AQT1_9APHY|nr:hypothetical protein OBBRIDRAFT_34597 [Obba rivulosa]